MQLLCELGDFRRFPRPTALMAYLVARPTFVGVRYGAITKTGNMHACKAPVSAAWKYTRFPSVALRQRQRH